ncbi:MAG: M73 family metallopeptidase [Oscillospiraceae bacterium]|jgi:hypothetical protein|nr:M73 family metallopeptidase [Oscillospiraceae bacterium]
MKAALKKYRKSILIAVIGCILISSLSFGVTSAWMFNQKTLSNNFLVGDCQIAIDDSAAIPDTLTPGSSFPKPVTITNTGNLPVYLRARVDFSTPEAAAHCAADLGPEWDDAPGDGFYYCAAPVPPGGSVTLCSVVTIDAAAGDLENFDITVYAECALHVDGDTLAAAWA